MSKSLAPKADIAIRRSVAMAVAMAFSVAAVAAAPAYAKNDKSNGNGNSTNSNGNSSNSNGNSGSNGNSNSGGGNSNSNNGGGSVEPPPVALPLCALSDLTPGAAACSGFFQGNLLNNSSPDVATQVTALNAIGLSNWDGSLAEGQLNLSSSIVDFQTALNGMTWIGVHFGAGQNSPSPGTPGGVTAFYKFDAGVNLNTFLLSYGSASAARLYRTGSAPIIAPPSFPVSGGNGGGIAPIPEPATWVMMILGFGAAGAILRRRRALVA